MLNSIVQHYGLSQNECTFTPFGNGLINHTWIVECRYEKYIFQQINDTVFPSPAMIAENIYLLNVYFKAHFPDYLFVSPVATLQNEEMVVMPGQGYFRLFKYVAGSVAYNTVDNAATAFEAARQFGKFTKTLAGFNTNQLNITLPDFHNLTLRFAQFTQALQQGNTHRIAGCKDSIDYIMTQTDIVDIFNQLKTSSHFKQRVTHHDTKISNVLFDKNGRGLCVIDLDTIMPGYFISDVGDMLRTYLSPVSEEEKDLSKIYLREEYFDAIVDGYLGEMKEELSQVEIKYFVYAGKFMIYMQAIRFLTDYINDDVYYGSKYEDHNLVRCNNQLELLKHLNSKEDALQQKILRYISNNAV